MKVYLQDVSEPYTSVMHSLLQIHVHVVGMYGVFNTFDNRYDIVGSEDLSLDLIRDICSVKLELSSDMWLVSDMCSVTRDLYLFLYISISESSHNYSLILLSIEDATVWSVAKELVSFWWIIWSAQVYDWCYVQAMPFWSSVKGIYLLRKQVYNKLRKSK